MHIKNIYIDSNLRKGCFYSYRTLVKDNEFPNKKRTNLKHHYRDFKDNILSVKENYISIIYAQTI